MKKLSIQDLGRLTVEEYKKQKKTPLVLVLDNIRSGLNVGSAFRTADAFALAHVYLCGITAVPPHREVLKTAIGASESVDWTYTESSGEAVKRLKSEGFEIWAVEQTDQSRALQEVDWDGRRPLALVFGNEVEGVSEEVLQQSDMAIEVPQFGTKHSLNVSVCVGVVTWELFRKIIKN